MEQATNQQVEAAFKGLLTPQARTHLETLTQDLLQEGERDSLTWLYNHFVVTNQRKVKRPRGRPTKRSKPSISTNSPWGAVRKLQSLELRSTFATHLKSNKERDAKKFLDTVTTSITSASAQKNARWIPVEALTDCYFVARMVQNNNDNLMSAVYYLFRILLIGDIAVAIYGKNGDIQDEDFSGLRDFVGRKYDEMDGQEKSKVCLAGPEEGRFEVLSADLKTVIQRGMRLVWFAKTFGTGSLFYLYRYFSDNFLDHGWTQVGENYDAAMDKLQSLGLAKKAAESGTTELADRVRGYLRTVYQIDEVGTTRG